MDFTPWRFGCGNQLGSVDAYPESLCLLFSFGGLAGHVGASGACVCWPWIYGDGGACCEGVCGVPSSSDGVVVFGVATFVSYVCGVAVCGALFYGDGAVSSSVFVCIDDVCLCHRCNNSIYMHEVKLHVL